MLRILVDENIPSAREALSGLGEVTLFKGRALERAQLLACDALIVRSVTKVNRALVEGTPVRYVASATAGIEHVNEADLAALGIHFASAPGSNALSVVEWVLSALSRFLVERGRRFEGLSVGVVGCGNVGGRLWRALEALGARVLPVDPPLREKTGDPRYVTLGALSDVDVLTFHVPCLRDGAHPTVNMVCAPFLAGLRRKPLFINASRGEVVDEAALLSALDGGLVEGAMLDVWQNEPDIGQTLLDRTLVSTPHIAGYAFTAKLKGLQMVVDDLTSWMKRSFKPSELPPTHPPWDWRSALGPEARPVLDFSPIPGESFDAFLHRVLTAAYDVRRDSQALKNGPRHSLAAHFDLLRKEYPRRSEWECYTLRTGKLPEGWAAKLAALGFKLL